MSWLRISLSLCLLSASSWANLLVNGSFETPVVPTNSFLDYQVGSAGITGWTVTGASGDVTVLNKGFNCCGVTFTSSDGNQAVDLTGLADDAVSRGLSQTLTLAAGPYILSFDVGNYSDPNGSGSPNPSRVQVFVNSVLLGTFSNANNTPGVINWQTFTLGFSATGSTTIELRNVATAGDDYTGVDNAVLNSAAPEPATVGYMALAGVFAIGALSRRARQSK